MFAAFRSVMLREMWTTRISVAVSCNFSLSLFPSLFLSLFDSVDFVPHNGSRDLDDRLVNLKVVESFFLFVPVILLELVIIIIFFLIE